MTQRARNLDGALCLVTGGAGYLAHSLTLDLVSVGAKVRRLFRADRRKPSFADPSVEDMPGDVTIRADLERACAGVDVVFHLAGQTSIYTAESDPPRDFEANVRPLIALGEICLAKAPSPKLVFAGTATVVGLTTEVPLGPNLPDAPVTIYDLHKLMGEQYIEYCARVRRLSGTTLRLCNVYGPGPPSGSSDRGVLNQMVRRAMNGEVLTVYGDGHQIRDYVYVEDVARAFTAAASASEATAGRHFVIGSGRGHTIQDAVSRVAAIVGKRLGKEIRVTNVEPPKGLSSIEHRSFVADPEPFEQATGFRPGVWLDDGIERTLDHFLTQETAK
jgi:nucleoside-diphosphate-sugar epimerase